MVEENESELGVTKYGAVANMDFLAEYLTKLSVITVVWPMFDFSTPIFDAAVTVCIEH